MNGVGGRAGPRLTQLSKGCCSQIEGQRRLCRGSRQDCSLIKELGVTRTQLTGPMQPKKPAPRGLTNTSLCVSEHSTKHRGAALKYRRGYGRVVWWGLTDLLFFRWAFYGLRTSPNPHKSATITALPRFLMDRRGLKSRTLPLDDGRSHWMALTATQLRTSSTFYQFSSSIFRIDGNSL